MKPNYGVNYIIGNNGAGKTTILEAIYLLARARPIQPIRNRGLITHDQNQLVIYSEIKRDNQTNGKIGLIKDKTITQVKSDGNLIKRVSDLAKKLPISIITPNIQRIIEEGPGHRRKLLNWGLFHVEQSYGSLLTKYNKLLRQRNCALTDQRPELDIWTQQLARIGEEIAVLHNRYVARWYSEIKELLKTTSINTEFEMRHYKGWQSNMSYEESLRSNQMSDQKRQFTNTGVHRMDIRLTSEGREIKNLLSRGQKKILASIMILAQAKMISCSLKETPILLIDDLHSELDTESYELLVSLLENLNMQTFITALSKQSAFNKKHNIKVFHVEHGCVTSE
jgi:DNA replication and repair protein RecF